MKILGAHDEFIVTGRFLKVVFRLRCSNARYMKNARPLRTTTLCLCVVLLGLAGSGLCFAQFETASLLTSGQANFQAATSDVASSPFGVIISNTFPPRQVQFGLKLLF